MDTVGSDTKTPRFYQRMVNGEYSLARTWWLYAVGSNALVQFIYLSILHGTPLFTHALPLLLFSVFVIWWHYLTLVGTWRACAHSTIHKAFIFAIKCWIALLAISDVMKLFDLFPLLSYL